LSLHLRKIIFILYTHYAISYVVNFFNAGVVTRDRSISSRLRNYWRIALWRIDCLMTSHGRESARNENLGISKSELKKAKTLK
jgi:hypothetical protein